MSAAIDMIYDTLDRFCGNKPTGNFAQYFETKTATKLYAKRINCFEKCPEAKNGKCQLAMFEQNSDLVYGYPADFPTDGKCYFPEFMPYDPEWESEGVYETEAVK